MDNINGQVRDTAIEILARHSDLRKYDGNP